MNKKTLLCWPIFVIHEVYFDLTFCGLAAVVDVVGLLINSLITFIFFSVINLNS